ncbi:MAG: hypothetical protein IPL46_27645 [Saprospiraceae bacterium]|nr:hypothetical protein [Saprospiraceae bacterium]
MATKLVEEKKKKENRYRLVVFSDSTFEEIRSFTFRPWYIWAILTAISLIVIIMMVALLIMTPLGTLFAPPNYTDSKELLNLREKVLKLQEAADAQSLYINNLRQILSGEVIIDADSSIAQLPEDSIPSVFRIDEDEQLRRTFDLEQQLQSVGLKNTAIEASYQTIASTVLSATHHRFDQFGI